MKRWKDGGLHPSVKGRLVAADGVEARCPDCGGSGVNAMETVSGKSFELPCGACLGTGCEHTKHRMRREARERQGVR